MIYDDFIDSNCVTCLIGFAGAIVFDDDTMPYWMIKYYAACVVQRHVAFLYFRDRLEDFEKKNKRKKERPCRA